MKKHTLIITTRNRPEYIHIPVSFYLGSRRSDIECLVVDGSDTPQSIRDFLSPFAEDRRLTIIDNSVAKTGHVPSMRENWEIALNRANGDWVSIIGDDDCLCPSLVDFIDELESASVAADAISWLQASYDIPNELVDGVKHSRPAKIPFLIKTAVDNPRKRVIEQLNWQGGGSFRQPRQVCGIYHGAVRRSLLLTVKEERSSWFRHECVDFDLGYAVSLRCPRRVLTGRCFSINGHSKSSNSWAINMRSALIERYNQWMSEARVIDGWSEEQVKFFQKNGIDGEFFFTLPMVLFGFTQSFCKIEGIVAEKEVPIRLIKSLFKAAATQPLKEDFNWYISQTKRFAELIFKGKALNFPDVKWLGQEINENPFFGYQEPYMYFDRESINYDYWMFCKIAFFNQPEVRFYFDNNSSSLHERGGLISGDD